MARTRKQPWKRARPKGASQTTLTPAARRSARRRARKSGRRYPNLVDNMRAATAATEAAEARMSAVRRRKQPKKSPKGGLTAAGRRWFARREGATLRPGVKKPRGRMTPAEMRPKGSCAFRFHGRTRLPRLRDEHGKPTRFALTAAAWGEPVPRTVAAARRIAKRGEALLAAYQRKKTRRGR